LPGKPHTGPTLLTLRSLCTPQPPRPQASLDTPQISAIIITDTDGERLVAKFWSPADFPDAAAELEFQKRLFKKVKAAGSGARADAEVLVLEGFTVVFKAGPDVTFAVVGPGEENDLMLVAVLDALWDTMSLLLKGAVDKRAILAQLELLLLALDELVEGGVPFELDPHTIEARVMLRGAVPETISSYNEMTLSTVRFFCRPRRPPAPPPRPQFSLRLPPLSRHFHPSLAGCGQVSGQAQEAVCALGSPPIYLKSKRVI